MNWVGGILDKSDFGGNESFLNFRIDDYWLDEKLEELYPGKGYKGLIPTLVLLSSDADRDVVWERILPCENETSICPILMCPDDCDFSCTLIVAKIQNCGKFILWKRIGLDETKDWGSGKVGNQVRWLEEVKEMSFERKEYLEMLDRFRQSMKTVVIK